MRLLIRQIFIGAMFIFVIGCAELKREPIEMKLPPPQPPKAPVPFKAAIQLHGRNVLTIHALFAQVDNVRIAYKLSPGDAGTQPADDPRVVYTLIPEREPAPALRCEIVYDDSKTQANVTVSADSRLPELFLQASTPTLMWPVRLTAAEDRDVVYSAMGPPVCGEIVPGFSRLEALFDPQEGQVLAITGKTFYLPEGDGGTLTATTVAHQVTKQTILTITSHQDFCKTDRHPDPPTGEVISSQASQVVAPSGWWVHVGETPLDDQKLERNLRWMATNLKPYGAECIFTDAPQSPADSLEMQPTPPLFSQTAMASIAGFGFHVVSYPPVEMGHAELPNPWLEPLFGGVEPSLQDLEQLARPNINATWNKWLTGRASPRPIVVGKPLTRDQAQLLASVVALSGQPVMMADALHRLPAERIAILRRILPPAPIRAVDLFDHGLPAAWNLNVVRKFGDQFEQWNIFGVFNWSELPETRFVRLTEVGIDTTAGVAFAVYDVWQERLLAVTSDTFEINVPPTACRLVCIRRLEQNRPTIIGTNRHITQGGIDLHDVKWDPDQLILSGVSDLIADDNYELRLATPRGDDSLEIVEVKTDVDAFHVRREGLLRIVTFESASSRSARWEVRFQHASNPTPAPPVAPARLRARQNTRGVRLTWAERDERTVYYRVYRDDELIARAEKPLYQDSDVFYGCRYAYSVTSCDDRGQESQRSNVVEHQTPIPASTNLTLLTPLVASQGRWTLRYDRSVKRNSLRMAGRRYYRGLGTHAPSHIRYFLGGGYDRFTGAVGIDDETSRRGSAVFRIVADGQTLFTSKVLRGGQPVQSFSVRVAGKKYLELMVEDAGDGSDFDHADWGNPYLSGAVHLRQRLSAGSISATQHPPSSRPASRNTSEPTTRRN